MAVLFLIAGAYILIDGGLLYTTSYKGIQLPFWVVEAAMLVFLILLAWIYFKYLRREEVMISVNDQLVQYMKERDKPGAFSPGCILVVSSRTFELKQWPDKWLMPEREISLVVIAGGERYGIVGAFREEQSAAKYAGMVSQVTGLDVRHDTRKDLKVINGNLRLRGTDEQALEVRVCELPIKRRRGC